MIERSFISQPLPLPKVKDADTVLEASPPMADPSINRIIMADFDVFHSSSHQRPKSNEDIELDTAQLYQEGVEAGKAEAAEIYDQTVKVMEMTLEQLKSRLESQVREIEESHARVLMRCLDAVLPDASKQVLRSEMAKILNQVLENGLKGILTARIHPENDTAKAFLQSKTNHPIEIIETSESPIGQVSFDWEDSHVVIDPMRAANECLSLLNAGLSDVEKPDCVQMPDSSLVEQESESAYPPIQNMNEKAVS